MPTAFSRRPVVILIVEDNPTDVLIAREGFLGAEMPNTLYVADDGIEAMEFLRQRGKYAEAPRPDLIVLDLNMPRKNGQTGRLPPGRPWRRSSRDCGARWVKTKRLPGCILPTRYARLRPSRGARTP